MAISEGEEFAYENSESYLAPAELVADIEQPPAPTRRGLRNTTGAILMVLVFALGLASGYLMRGYLPVDAVTGSGSEQAAVPAVVQAQSEPIQQASSGAADDAANDTTVATAQEPARTVITLPISYTLPASFGDIGPQLLDAGAIDYDRFVQVYEQAGRPLSAEQLRVLAESSDAPIVIDRENAYFLLNFFWAFGLTNKNPVLEEGVMMQYSQGEIGRFASTGGWTVGTKPATGLYSTVAMVTLTPEQQARLEEVAAAVYRPCCNNPTAFPDCNHGMAMLGLLELMAAQGASTDQMFEAAKYINAFWFPQQTLEQAIFFQASQGLDFAEVDARQMVGRDVSSAAGFRAVHQALASNGLLEQGSGGGNSCGV